MYKTKNTNIYSKGGARALQLHSQHFLLITLYLLFFFVMNFYSPTRHRILLIYTHTEILIEIQFEFQIRNNNCRNVVRRAPTHRSTDSILNMFRRSFVGQRPTTNGPKERQRQKDLTIILALNGSGPVIGCGENKIK